MEFVNLIKNNSSENLKELFQENNCKVHEYDSNTLVRYPHGTDLNNREEWMKSCRGAVYSENKVLHVYPLRLQELNDISEIPENSLYREYTDGTLMSVWYNDTKEKWYIGTRGKIGALCRWQNTRTFRSMFLDILNKNNGNFDVLDRTKSYTFVMVHKDNRIVQKYNNNELVLVAVWDKNENEFVNIANEIDKIKESQEEFPVNLWFRQSNVYTREEFNSIINNSDAKEVAGFVICDMDKKYKIMNKNYKEYKKLQGESHIPLFNYLNNRLNGKIPNFLKVYPEKRREYNHMKYKVHDFTQDLYDTYGYIFKEKRFSLKEAPFSMKPFLYELHGEFLSTKKPVAFNTVMEFTNKQPVARLYFALSKYLKEQNDKKKLEIDEIVNDSVEEIVAEISDQEDINNELIEQP